MTRVPCEGGSQAVAEQGLAGFEAGVWCAMVGPAKLPAEIVVRVDAARNAALADPGVQAAIRKQGDEPQPGSAADPGRQIRTDSDEWAKVVRDARIAFE
jgi:tripartite-type tricarboxylate transporter receptor subunit TctC